VIRYRTRDLTRLLPGTARSMRRMEKITGRSDDMMIIRGVNVFPSQIEEQILTIEGLTPHYLCVLTRPGNLDELTVQVEHAPGHGDVARDPEVLGAALRERIKQRIGVTVSVEVLAPQALERSLGKARRINDLREPPG
jgi:phenylacetate-CoA ligase